MRGSLLTGSPKKSVMLLDWLCSIFRALSVIPSRQKMGNQKLEGKGMNKREGRESQKEGKAAKGN